MNRAMKKCLLRTAYLALKTGNCGWQILPLLRFGATWEQQKIPRRKTHSSIA
jgi:hypothetical protein